MSDEPSSWERDRDGERRASERAIEYRLVRLEAAVDGLSERLRTLQEETVERVKSLEVWSYVYRAFLLGMAGVTLAAVWSTILQIIGLKGKG